MPYPISNEKTPESLSPSPHLENINPSKTTHQRIPEKLEDKIRELFKLGDMPIQHADPQDFARTVRQLSQQSSAPAQTPRSEAPSSQRQTQAPSSQEVRPQQAPVQEPVNVREEAQMNQVVSQESQGQQEVTSNLYMAKTTNSPAFSNNSRGSANNNSTAPSPGHFSSKTENGTTAKGQVSGKNTSDPPTKNESTSTNVKKEGQTEGSKIVTQESQNREGTSPQNNSLVKQNQNILRPNNSLNFVQKNSPTTAKAEGALRSQAALPQTPTRQTSQTNTFATKTEGHFFEQSHFQEQLLHGTNILMETQFDHFEQMMQKLGQPAQNGNNTTLAQNGQPKSVQEKGAQFIEKGLTFFAKMSLSEKTAQVLANSFSPAEQTALKQEMPKLLVLAQMMENGTLAKAMLEKGESTHLIQQAVNQLLAKGELPQQAALMLKNMLADENIVSLLIPFLEKQERLMRLKKKKRKKEEEEDSEELEEEFTSSQEFL